MLALALGFLGAVIVAGAFCGGVFLGCWLCGEEGTPARVRPARRSGQQRKKRRKKRRTYRDAYDDGYDRAYDDEWEPGYGEEEREAVKREAVKREAAAESVHREAAAEQEAAGEQETAEEQEAAAVQEASEEREREAARQRRRLLDEQAAFRALQHYSAERAYGLDRPGAERLRTPYRSGLD